MCGSATARWNGNISEWSWQHGTGVNNMYGFEYDGVNRLLGSTQYVASGNSWVAQPSHYTESGISYDKNGNILALQRSAAGTIVDNLTYSYTGNRLTKLNNSANYLYDTNGNLTFDGRDNLTFTYNWLNLLNDVKQGGALKARYTWTSDGTKLRVRDGAGVDGFDYLGSLVYANGSAGLRLESAGFAGGRIIASSGQGGTTVYTPNYFLTDHLGSVRAIVDASGDVKQQNDYYPFGARHVRNDYPNNNNRYLYNGKEAQTTGSLPYLDYGARMYDARIGRWFAPDPLAELFSPVSPYAYALNNPVRFIDVLGLYPSDPEWFDSGRGTPENPEQIGRVEVVARRTASPVFFGWGSFDRQQAERDRRWESEMEAQRMRAELDAMLGDLRRNSGRSFLNDMFNALPGYAFGAAADAAFARGDYLGWAKNFGLGLAEMGVTAFTFGKYSLASTGVRGVAVGGVKAGAQGFTSFSAFKRAMGPAGPGKAWHHIVEQTPGNVAKFGSQTIHNTGNLMKLPSGAGSIHAQVSGYYSSIQPFTGGLTVRQWLSTQSYQAQYNFGIQTLTKFGWVW